MSNKDIGPVSITVIVICGIAVSILGVTLFRKRVTLFNDNVQEANLCVFPEGGSRKKKKNKSNKRTQKRK